MGLPKTESKDELRRPIGAVPQERDQILNGCQIFRECLGLSNLPREVSHRQLLVVGRTADWPASATSIVVSVSIFSISVIAIDDRGILDDADVDAAAHDAVQTALVGHKKARDVMGYEAFLDGVTWPKRAVKWKPGPRREAAWHPATSVFPPRCVTVSRPKISSTYRRFGRPAAADDGMVGRPCDNWGDANRRGSSDLVRLDRRELFQGKLEIVPGVGRGNLSADAGLALWNHREGETDHVHSTLEQGIGHPRRQ